MCGRFILEIFSEATPLSELESRAGEGAETDAVATEASADPRPLLTLLREPCS